MLLYQKCYGANCSTLNQQSRGEVQVNKLECRYVRFVLKNPKSDSDETGVKSFYDIMNITILGTKSRETSETLEEIKSL